MARTKKSVPKLKETETVKVIRGYCKELYTKGWKTVHMEYQGSGDSCDDFGFSLENAETTANLDNVDDKDLPVDFKLEKFKNALLDLLPAGFENNEGGDGTIKIDTASGKIHVKHNAYYTESHHEEWSY